MKKKLWALALIGLFAVALVPVSAHAENDPPTWDPCGICPPTITTPPATSEPTPEPTPEPTTTDPAPTCPEQPPTTTTTGN